MKKALILLIVASILGNIAGGLYTPVHAIFVQKIGGSILNVGWASTIYFVATGFFIFYFGRLSDKIGKKKLLVLGFLLLFLGDVYFIFIQNVLMLFIGQVILGIGIAMTNPSWNGIFSMLLEHGKEASFWGTWEFLISIGIAIAAISGAFIVNSLGFTYLFGFKAALHLGSAFFSMKIEGIQ